VQRLPPMRALKVFETFGRLGTATAAAVELGVTVGAVSQQLRIVEAEVGLPLIERKGKQIALTGRGRQYHDDVKAAFDLLRAAQEKVERAHSEATLTISCLPSVASKWLAVQLFDWQKAHPKANVRLIGENAEPNLSEDGVDFRLTYGEMVNRFKHRTELFTDWMVPACSPELLTRLDLKSPADVLDAPLLGIEWAREQGAAPTWGDWAAMIGVSRRKAVGAVTFSLSSAAIDAAINGRGFVLAQMSMTAVDVASGRLVIPFDLRLKLPHPYALAWDPPVLSKPFGPELHSWIQAVARRQRAASTPRRTTHSSS